MEIPQRSSLVPCQEVVSFRSEVRQMEEAAKETVIIVHGTFAAPELGASRWYQPTEPFIAKLNDALQKRGSAARCWAHCSQGDQGFHWSGENSWVARTQAAAKLRSYVLNLRNEGWCCHIVAHSHGGNVVLEALPQITTALPFTASLGKIVTLGTPFMDAMSPIRERIRRTQRFIVGLSLIASVWISLFPQIVNVFGFAGRDVVLVGTNHISSSCYRIRIALLWPQKSD
jgi:alpha-beta hydrolase superfamily lysophospholipase